MTNRQWRRICMPFLFAYVSVDMERAGEFERLRDECVITNAAFATSIRYVISPSNQLLLGLKFGVQNARCQTLYVENAYNTLCFSLFTHSLPDQSTWE